MIIATISLMHDLLAKVYGLFAKMHLQRGENKSIFILVYSILQVKMSTNVSVSISENMRVSERTSMSVSMSAKKASSSAAFSIFSK